jgi:hypothetical protein
MNIADMVLLLHLGCMHQCTSISLLPGWIWQWTVSQGKARIRYCQDILWTDSSTVACFGKISETSLVSVPWHSHLCNQVVEVNVKVEEPGPDNPHNNAFYAEETLLRSELEAQRDCNSLTARHWLVQLLSISPSVTFLIKGFFCKF